MNVPVFCLLNTDLFGNYMTNEQAYNIARKIGENKILSLVVQYFSQPQIYLDFIHFKLLIQEMKTLGFSSVVNYLNGSSKTNIFLLRTVLYEKMSLIEFLSSHGQNLSELDDESIIQVIHENFSISFPFDNNEYNRIIEIFKSLNFNKVANYLQHNSVRKSWMSI